MIRTLRLMLIAATVGAMLFVVAAGALAAGTRRGAQPGGSCSSTSSAINQYCENIPSATGGSTPPGTVGPSVGTTLPPSGVRAYRHLPAAERKRARRLLSLPAPTTSVPVTSSIHHGAWSLPVWVILSLIAIAAAGAAALITRRRRSTA
jgi:hypothetical protein